MHFVDQYICLVSSEQSNAMRILENSCLIAKQKMSMLAGPLCTLLHKSTNISIGTWKCKYLSLDDRKLLDRYRILGGM